MTVSAPVNHWSSRLRSGARHEDAAAAASADGERAAPRDAAPLTVTVECPAGDTEHAFVGDVLDLSKSGAKLCLAAALPLHEAITLHVRDEAGAVSLSVSATICWSRQSSPGRWRIGASFGEELPAERIHELAEAGYLERREHTRTPVAGNFTVQWQLDSHAAPALLEDLSEGGFCMICQEVGRVRDRVRLTAQDAQQVSRAVMATVRWQARLHVGYLVGCEFVEPRGYEMLQGYVEKTPGKQSTNSPATPAHATVAARQPRRLRRWLAALGAASLATIAGWATLPADLLLAGVCVVIAGLVSYQCWAEGVSH